MSVLGVGFELSEPYRGRVGGRRLPQSTIRYNMGCLLANLGCSFVRRVSELVSPRWSWVGEPA